jgi:hypothetical protein
MRRHNSAKQPGKPFTTYASTALLAFLFTHPGASQLQSDSHRSKGFTEAHPEHIIVQLHEPIVVRDVRGEMRDRDGNPEKNAIFEIRLKSSSQIRRAKTDEKGQFRIQHAPTGTYDFKATLDGFQSVVGTVIVSATADPKAKIKLTLNLGV